MHFTVYFFVDKARRLLSKRNRPFQSGTYLWPVVTRRLLRRIALRSLIRRRWSRRFRYGLEVFRRSSFEQLPRHWLAPALIH